MSHRPRLTSRRTLRAFRLEELESRTVPALVASYGFEEPSGNTATDSSGLNNTGTLSGPTRVPGRYGKALSFDGVDDWVTVSGSNVLDLTTELTMSAWVYPTSSNDRETVILKESSATRQSYALYVYDKLGQPQTGPTKRNGHKGVYGSSALPLNAWSHLAATYDGSFIRVYVNGMLVGETAQTGATSASANPLRIGGNSIWGEYFDGRIDEVRIYNHVQTAAQILIDMTTPVVDTADQSPPTVVAVTPLMGAVAVAPTTNLTIRFSEAMTADSITPAAFDLRDPGGMTVPFAVTYNAATLTATLNPTSDFTAAAGYYVATAKAGGAQDAAGNALAADFTWAFSPATPQFQEESVFTGLVNPTVVKFAPDGRVFVAEKSGLVKVFDNLQDTTATVFADLRTKVHNYWDRGLLGMTLHPDFANNPYVYVLYTHDAPIGGTAPAWGAVNGTNDPGPATNGNGSQVSGRLSRLTVGTNGTWDGNELVLVEDWANQYPSHSIGSVAFGADGYLYATAGDGASFNFADRGQNDGLLSPPIGDPVNEGGATRSQDLRTTGDPTGLDGSVIRIDPVTGASVPTNPLFATGNDENARRTIAYGLRNPFRFTFRPGTNELWIGDVGWNEWEEINRIVSPTDATVENFGWPAYEGTNRQTAYDNLNVPILENLYAQGAAAHATPYYGYRHSEQVAPGSAEPTGSSAIAGLAFSRGGNMPAGFDDALFFTDYNRDTIWVMYRGVNGLPDPANRAVFYRNTNSPAGATDAVNLEIGPGGLLYFPDFDSGVIRRIRYTGNNQAPTAVIQASATVITPGTTVNFSSTGSSDPEGGPLTYAWDLDGDGAFDDSTASAASFTYAAAGAYTVGLRVTDDGGLNGVATVSIIVGNTPTATIVTPTIGSLFAANTTLSFAGSATDPEDGTLPATGLTWTFSYYQADPTNPNNVNLRNRQTFSGVAAGTYTTPDWEFPVYLVIDLTATDSNGLTHTRSLRVDPQTVGLIFDTNPDGLELSLNGRTNSAPYARTLVVGSVNQIGVPTQQTLSGTTYAFQSWSDGGAAVHFVNAPASPATYTATFAVDTRLPGLVGAWGFEDGAGPTAADRSGNALHGTISGAARTTAGRYGNALSFDGINDWVTVNDNNLLDLTTGMTLSAWVYPTATNGWETVILKESAATQQSYALYAFDGTGRPPAGYVYRSTPEGVFGPSTLPLNAWSNLAVTYDGAAMRLYVNGIEVSTRAMTGPTSISANPLRFGGNSVSGEYFNGRIDEVRIYNRALSADEITFDMNTPVGGGRPQRMGVGPVPEGPTEVPTPTDFAPVSTEVVHQWAVAGLIPSQRAALGGGSTRIADLGPTGKLALAPVGGSVVTLNDDGGHGWSFDPISVEDAEFTPRVGLAELQATGGPASDLYDLLSVAMHKLGRSDLDPAAVPHVRMTDALNLGTRILPAALGVPVVPPLVWFPVPITDVDTDATHRDSSTADNEDMLEWEAISPIVVQFEQATARQPYGIVREEQKPVEERVAVVFPWDTHDPFAN